MPLLTPSVLAMLACPVCHQALHLQVDTVLCQGCGRRYPLADGIPVLIPERAIV